MVKKNDVEIVVCSKSLFYIIGTEIDWKDDVMGQKFEFNNPNAASKCGCNTSMIAPSKAATGNNQNAFFRF